MAQHSIISGTTIRKDATYKFQVALSKDAYCNKQQVLAAISPKDEGRKLRKQNGVKQKMSFINVEVTAEQLLDYAINGYTFCTLHSGFPENNPLERKTYVKHDGSYTLTAKCDDYFSGSFFIGVDIDETQYKSPIDFIEKLSMKPTFWYTSFSNQQIENGENKGARFRMIYVFNQLIEDKFFFRYCSFKLHSLIELETEEEIHDKCGMLASQYFNGTNWNNKSLKIDFGISNAIYSLDDINCSYDDYYTFLCNDCYYKKNLTHKDKKEIEERKCILLLRIPAIPVHQFR